MTSAEVSVLVNAGVAGVVLTAIGYFIDRRFWPWFVKDYWPIKVKQDQDEVTILREIRDALIQLREVSSAQTLNQVSIKDMLTRIEFRQERYLVPAALKNGIADTGTISSGLDEPPLGGC